jgi:hypothetical protein
MCMRAGSVIATDTVVHVVLHVLALYTVSTASATLVVVAVVGTAHLSAVILAKLSWVNVYWCALFLLLCVQ